MFFEHFHSFGPLMIPILALLIPIVAIVTHYLGKANTERLRHETIRELVKAGQPILPELLLETQQDDWQRPRNQASNPNRMLIPAVINIATGFGLMIMFSQMMPGAWLWSIGFLPLFLGLGFLVYWQVERKTQAAQQQQQL